MNILCIIIIIIVTFFSYFGKTFFNLGLSVTSTSSEIFFWFWLNLYNGAHTLNRLFSVGGWSTVIRRLSSSTSVRLRSSWTSGRRRSGSAPTSAFHGSIANATIPSYSDFLPFGFWQRLVEQFLLSVIWFNILAGIWLLGMYGYPESSILFPVQSNIHPESSILFPVQSNIQYYLVFCIQ